MIRFNLNKNYFYFGNLPIEYLYTVMVCIKVSAPNKVILAILSILNIEINFISNSCIFNDHVIISD